MQTMDKHQSLINKPRFRASINLQLDLADERLLSQYVLSTPHAEVLRGIVNSVIYGGTRAHLLIGPYGTGKSYLATIVSQLLSRYFDTKWRTKLQRQAERIDTLFAEHLRGLENLERTYIPVIINGSIGAIRTIINRSVYREMKERNIEITTPNEVEMILQTVKRWEIAYRAAYKGLLKHVEDVGLSIEDWTKKVESFDEDIIRRFIRFYPSVTSGTRWMVDHEELFIENLSEISNMLRAQGKGIFIVYDEFGRFLQTLEGPDSMRNMQDLQDLAEFVNHTDNVQLLIIGHKQIRQYAELSRESLRVEFEKIEKRFRTYSLETDQSTYLRLASEAAAELNEEALQNAEILESVELLQHYQLFSGYTTHELEINILRSLFPLHPVGAVLLPELSNIFGQNERTLFSFFTDSDTFGMHEHVRKGSGYYYADRLFHFFNVASAETRDQPTLQLYHVVVQYIDERDLLQRRIVELMTLWAALRFTRKQPLTSGFLAFALGVSEKEATTSLEQLACAKVARFNAIRGHWEIYDGSSIDLSTLVSERTGTVVLSQARELELLNRYLPISYVIPYEYNDRMDMLRYAEVRFTFPSMLEEVQADTAFDDRIFLVLFPDNEAMTDVLSGAQHALWTSVVALPKFTMIDIKEILRRYHVVEELQKDVIFVSQDNRLKSELHYMQEEIGMTIRNFVQRYFDFSSLQWWSAQGSLEIHNERELEHLISERLGRKFYLTPSIRNEAFNRNRISSVQRRAMIDVIDRLINNPSELNLGIKGYGPNYLIYASVLKNNQYDYANDKRVHCCDSLLTLRTLVLERLRERPIGRLSELIEPFSSEPYGIRSAVIPVLFVALLRDVWEQLSFYAHDMLTSHLSGSGIVELLEHSEQYEYRYHNLTVEEKVQLLALGQQFALSPETCSGFLPMSQALLEWLRTLPKFALTTDKVSEQTMLVRSAIRSSEVDPHKFIGALITMGDVPGIAKIELEEFLNTNKIELDRQLSEWTHMNSTDMLLLELSKMPVELIGLNSRLLTVTTSVPEVNNGVSLSPIDRLAEHLVGVSRSDWSDATHNLFLQQFRYEWELLSPNVKEAAVALADIPIPTTIELSKKANVLYTNVKNMLKYAGKDITTAELRALLGKLMREV